ncbi:hypothetical protein [Erythrobacter sp. F6033]|uniref:hypothetical protein n=1 Tax=Erythrobacter sp. F6033 TaxID=2926401 RepID=UPI001FF49090|nr:hypothetical protein [Erythrobacter sp. F6033]MCK0127795.1 hypothetical protein [Erythrobacter sp. F6033]
MQPFLQIGISDLIKIGILSFPVLALAACKPPPTDAGLDREMPASEPTYASEPLASPDTEGAIWAQSTEANRIIYGVPGEPALIALACIERDGQSEVMRITRISPADEGAGALLALIGNGSIGRIEVDATKQGRSFVWQGELPAADTKWEPFNGPRQATVTVPGAGMVTLNASRLPEELLSECRGIPPVVEAPDDEPIEGEEPTSEESSADEQDTSETPLPPVS